MSDIMLLREFDVAPAFKTALRQAAEAVVAVPFWGKGAATTLGLTRKAPVRVICNLDHPGCNPDAIDKLLDLGLRVRTHRRLHAKIYATPALAIVGSSNVSSNGLTVEGSAARGWVEANVASSDEHFVEKVLALFEEIWTDELYTRVVRRADIKAARKAREALPPFLYDLSPRLSLFEAVRERPKAFASVYVAAYSKDMSKAARARFKQLKDEAAAPGGELKVADFRNAHGYQFERIPPGAWLIGIDCRNKSAPRFWGCALASTTRLKVDGEYDLTIAFRGKIRVGEREFRLLAAEKAQLFGASKRIMRRAGDTILPLSEALDLIR